VVIQKTTVFDPKEGQYHLTFSHILLRQGKLDRAGKEAGLAIQLADKPSPGMFQHRAQLRWRQQDYLGAANDWEQAIKLAPKNPSYYASTAEAYAQAKKWSLALSLYQQAMDLDRQHKGYQEKHALLKKRLVPDGN
jgi:tetratricopeptide (TPR) repeat protein